MCDDLSDSCVSNSEVILKATLVSIKPKFDNPSSGQTSKSSSDSRKKPWLNKKMLLTLRSKPQMILKRKLVQGKIPDSLRNQKRMCLEQLVQTLGTTIPLCMLIVKILKSPSNPPSSVVQNKYLSPNPKQVNVETPSVTSQNS